MKDKKSKESSRTSVLDPEIMAILEKELPSFFTRRMAVEKLNGLFSYSTLANYAHRKIGPPVHYMGSAACYTKKTFLEWLRSYLGGMTVEYKGYLRTVCRKQKQEEEDEQLEGIGIGVFGGTVSTAVLGEGSGGTEEVSGGTTQGTDTTGHGGTRTQIL